MSTRRERLQAARLYLVCDQLDDDFLRAALRGGVDIVQLRIKHGAAAEILAVARRFALVCAEQDALLILNDRPDLAVLAGADGVHIGQDDAPVAQARRVVGPELIVGLSTHSPAQIDAAAAAGADYIGVGPVHGTPTKPGRPAVGLELVRWASTQAAVPWFAIGGIDTGSATSLRAAGATRIAVVRALTLSRDPEQAARRLRAAIDPQPAPGEVRLGAA